MSRRGKSFFEEVIDDLSGLPWQVGATLSGICGVFLLFPHNYILTLVFMFFAVAGAVGAFGSFWKGAHNKKVFSETNSLPDIKTLSWRDFENYVGEYYRHKGFEVSHIGGNGPDGGIDLVATKNTGEKIIIQCKQWRAYKVPVQIVREVYGVMVDNAASGAAVITTGTFTRDAEEFAGNKPIELIDGEYLAMLISDIKNAESKPAPMPRKSRAVLIPTEPPPLPAAQDNRKYMPPAMRAELEGKDKEFADAHPVCPHCKKPMVLRVAHRGANPGAKFWGCANYPACRHTVPIV